jgi:hypothetical protein
MKPPSDRPSATDGERHRTAFGLALCVDPKIVIRGLGEASSNAVAEPCSHVRLDPDELKRRWQGLSTSAVRVRELSAGSTLLRSVDFAESVGYLLWARGFGRVLITPDGLELLCEPDPVNGDWARIVASQALPLAATIRGFEVFHASGVVVDGRAALITGPPGAGKSSLAAALLRAGGELLSDDAVAVQLSDGELIAHAGSTVLQLRPPEEERLSVAERAEVGQAAGSFEGKHLYVSSAARGPVPIGGLFLLERSHEEPPVERLAAVDPFELIASTFNLSVRTPARLRHQLDVVSEIASGGLAHRLRVQDGVDATRLAEIVQGHLAELHRLGRPVPADSASGVVHTLGL